MASDMEMHIAIAGKGKHHEQRRFLHLLALASRALLISTVLASGSMPCIQSHSSSNTKVNPGNPKRRNPRPSLAMRNLAAYLRQAGGVTEDTTKNKKTNQKQKPQQRQHKNPNPI